MSSPARDRVRRLVPHAAVATAVLALVVSAGWGAHLHATGEDSSSRTASPSVDTPATTSPYSEHLIAGPALPVHGQGPVETDLDARMLRLDPRLAVRLPDDLVMGGFRGLDAYAELFTPAHRALQRALLVRDHFEGSVLHVWGSTGSSTRYWVDLQRFAKPASATERLGEFVHGALNMPAGARPTHASVPDGLAFLDRRAEVGGRYRELTQYFARGRYFGYIRVLVKDDVTLRDLRRLSALVTRGQYARTSGGSPGSVEA